MTTKESNGNHHLSKVDIPFWRQLRWNLVVYFVLLVILPVTGVSTILIHRTNTETKEEVTEHLTSVSQLKMDQIENWLRNAQETLNLTSAASNRAGFEALLRASAEEPSYDQQRRGVNEVMTEAVESQGFFDKLILYDTQGEVIAASDEADIGKIIANRPYYEDSLIGEFVQPPYYTLGAGELTMVATRPVVDSEGETLGVLAGQLDLRPLDSIMTQRAGLGETGETYLISAESNYLLTASRFEEAGYVTTRAYHSEGIDSALRGEEGSGVYSDYRDPPAQVVGVYRWVPELQAALMAEQDVSEALAGARRTRNFIISVAGGFALLAGAIGLYVATRVSNPVNRLTETASRIAAGDLDARAEVSIPNEVGILANTFNSMVERVSGLLTDVQERTAELEERTRELEASQRVTFAASEHATPEELLGLVVDLIRDQFDLYHAQVYLVDEEQGAAVLRQSTGYAGRQLLQRGHEIPLDATALVTEAVRTGEPVLVDNTEEDPNFMPNQLLPDTRSELVVPLQRDEQVIGVLDVQDREPGRFDESTINLFQSMTDQVAMLFENAELMERITDQTERLTAFTNQLRTAAQIAHRLNTILDPDRLAQETVEMLQSRFGLYHAHIYLLNEDERKLNLLVGSGEVGRVLKEQGHAINLDADKSLVARAARNRHTVAVEDTSLESDFMPNPLLPETRSEVAVPLIVGERVLGVMDVQDNQPNRFSEADVDTLGILAGQIATAMQTATLFEQTDTRLRVSRALAEAQTEDEVLDVMIEQASIYPEAQVALMLTDRDAEELTMEIVRTEASQSGLQSVPVGTRLTKENLPVLELLSPTDDLVVNDVGSDERMDPQSRGFMTEMGIQGGANIPLAIGDTWLGELVINTRQKNFFDQQKLNLYHTLAEQGTNALRTARLQDEVRASVARFEGFAEATEYGFGIADLEGHIIYANNSLSQMLGEKSPEAMIDKAIMSYYPPEIQKKLEAEVLPTVMKDGIWRGELELQAVDGKRTPVEENYFLIRGGDGEPRYVADIITDITERKQAEEALRENEERLDLAMEAANAGVWEFWPQDDEAFFNERWFTMLGYGPDELEHSYATWRSLLHPKDLEAAEEVVFDAIEKGAGFSVEFRMKTKDGGWRWIHDIGKTVEWTEDGASKRMLGTHTDITENKIAEMERERFTTRLETAAEISEQVGSILDPDDLLHAVIPLIKERFGLYYVHVYTLDEESETLNLRAGYGEAGEKMLAEGHAIPLGREASLVAQAARTHEPVLVDDVTEDPNFMPNPLLPDTKTEVAIPVIAGGEVLGVFDVQHDEADYFTEADLDVFQTLAGQIANALRSARLFEQTQASEQRFRGLYEASPLGIILNDFDTGDYLEANDRFLEMVGYTVDELNSLSYWDLTPKKYDEDEQAMIRSMEETGEYGPYEKEYIHKDGTVFPVALNGVLVTDPTGRRLIWSTVEDITERVEAERQILESEQQLSAAMDLADMATWEFDVATQTFTFNDYYYETFFDATVEEVGGYEMTAEEFAKRFVPPEDAALVGGNIQEAIESDDPDFQHRFESRSLTLDGQQRWVSIWFRTEKDNEGRTVKLHGVNQDITERKQREAFLQEQSTTLAELTRSETVYSGEVKAALEEITEAAAHTLGVKRSSVWFYDTDNTKIECVDLYEQDEGHSQGTELSEEDFPGYFEALAKEHVIVAHDAHSNPHTREFSEPYLNPLGITSMLDVPIRMAGEMIGVVCFEHVGPAREWSLEERAFATSIADFVASAMEAYERKKFNTQLRTAAELAEEINAILDPDHLLPEVVEELQDRFDLYHVHIYALEQPPAELLEQADGEKVERIMRERDLTIRAGSGEVGQGLLEQGHAIPLYREKSLVARAARNQAPVLVNDTRDEPDFLPNPLLPDTHSEVAVPLIAGENVLGVLDVQDDQPGRFTQSDVDILSTLAGQIATAMQNARYFEEIQETAEKLREVDVLKSEFLASMSHELRTPLNSIIGYTEIMLMGIDSELSPEMQEDIQAIYDNGQHLLQIINDVLDLAKIEAGRLEMEMEEVPVETLVEAASSSVEGLLANADKPIEFNVEVEDELPVLWGDQRRLGQVLNNLTSNAVKFTDKGHIILRAFADRSNGRDDGWVCIEVEDTGIGISEADQESIFERFQQVDSSHAREAEGTGLGLAITRHLAEMHGGTVEVRSELGEGSTFTVRLPVGRPDVEIDTEAGDGIE